MMQSEHAVRKAYRARFNQLNRTTKRMLALMKSGPDTLSGEDIGRLRAEAEDAVQCAHEFSAYWNVVHTGGK